MKSLLALFLLSSTSLVFAQTNAPTPVGNLSLKVFLNGQPASLALNGFPLIEGSAGQGIVLTFEVLPYLKKTGNVLTMDLPRVAVQGDETKSLKVTFDTESEDRQTDTLWLGFDRYITLVQVGTDDTDNARQFPVEQGGWTFGGDTLQRFEFRLETGVRSSVEIADQPRTFEHRFESVAGPDKWMMRFRMERASLESLPWDGATPSLSEGDKQAMRNLTLQLKDAIQARDGVVMRELFASKIRRFSEALQIPPSEMSDAVVFTFEVLDKDGANYVFDAVDAASLGFRTFENSALVEVTANGSAPIRAVSGEDVFTKRVFIAKEEGNWVLVD